MFAPLKPWIFGHRVYSDDAYPKLWINPLTCPVVHLEYIVFTHCIRQIDLSEQRRPTRPAFLDTRKVTEWICWTSRISMVWGWRGRILRVNTELAEWQTLKLDPRPCCNVLSLLNTISWFKFMHDTVYNQSLIVGLWHHDISKMSCCYQREEACSKQ